MTEACVVPNCSSGHVPGDKPVAFFNPPENAELRSKWIAALSRTGVALNTTDAVCEKHFYESDIIRHYIVQDAVGNVVEKVAYDYPRLADLAVPSIFPGCELRVNGTTLENGLPPQQPPLQAPERSNANAASDALYNYMLIDTISDAAAHALTGTAHAVGHVVAHSQPPKIVEPEVVSHVAGNITENQPLLGAAEVNHNIAIPSLGDDIAGEAVKQTTNSLDVLQVGDVPVTSEPVPIFVQPVSTFALSENVANGGAADAAGGGCCDCDDGCCDCGDGCCECGDDCCDCGACDGCCDGDCGYCCDCGDCAGGCGDCGDCVGCCVS